MSQESTHQQNPTTPTPNRANLASIINHTDESQRRVERALMPDPGRLLFHIIMPTLRQLPSKLGPIDIEDEKDKMESLLIVRRLFFFISFPIIGWLFIEGFKLVPSDWEPIVQTFVIGFSTAAVCATRKSMLGIFDGYLARRGGSTISRILGQPHPAFSRISEQFQQQQQQTSTTA